MSRPVIRGFGGQRRIYAPQFRSYELEEFGDAFEVPGGRFRKEIEELELLRPLPDEYGIYQPTQAPQYYPRLPAPPPAPVEAPVPDEIEAFFASRFMQIDLELEGLRRRQEPLLVSGGRVATFSLVGMAGGGDAVFQIESDLEVHHVSAQQAKNMNAAD